MLNEDGPPVVRPPSPTVRPERTSPPKPVPKRDPRLLAVRIEKKQAAPFSKKVLEDHGITQPDARSSARISKVETLDCGEQAGIPSGQSTSTGTFKGWIQAGNVAG